MKVQFFVSKYKRILLCCLAICSFNIALGQTTWYSYLSGDWDDFSTWTQDPSGALRVNPNNLTPTTSPTSADDHVVILNGKSVSITAGNNDKANASLTVNGILSIGTTTGHRFSTIHGNGRVRLSGDNFPTGTATNFTGTNGGTVEYFGDFNIVLTVNRSFRNLVVNMLNGAILTLMADYTIGGDLTIERGTFRINDNTSTQKRDLLVSGNFLVEENGLVRVGTGNTVGSFSISGGVLPAVGEYHSIFHQITIGGNFINYGSVRFCNITNPVYNNFATNGAVTVRFTGVQNRNVMLYQETNFYNLIIDKGVDRTFLLNLYSASNSFFRILGPNNLSNVNSSPFSVSDPEVRKALWIRNGTLRLTGNINLPSLTEGGSSYTIGENGAMWVSGASVNVNVTAISGTSVNPNANGNQGLLLYGLFRISAGNLLGHNGEGILYGSASPGELVIEGGNVNICQFRARSGTDDVINFRQTGGALTIRGNHTDSGGSGSEVNTSFAMFFIGSPSSTFTMSGGSVIINSIGGGAAPNGIDIRCAEINFNVTGGRFLISILGGRNFHIHSTVDLWDVELFNLNNVGTGEFQLRNSLVVANSLTLHDNVQLNTLGGRNLSIQRNFTIGQTNSSYTPTTNITSFYGNVSSEFVCLNSSSTPGVLLHHFAVNKTYDNLEVRLVSSGRNDNPAVASSNMLTVNGNFSLERGVLDYQNFRVTVKGNVVNRGILGKPETNGRLLLDGTANHTIATSPLASVSFGHVELNNSGAGIGATLESDVNFYRFTLSNTIIDIGEHRLNIGEGGLQGTDFSEAKMIRTNGNASSKGVRLAVSLAGTYSGTLDNPTIVIPVGVFHNSANRYAPALIAVNGSPGNVSGTIDMNPVNSEHPSVSNSNRVIPFYWISNVNGFAGVDRSTISYRFIYFENISNNQNKCVALVDPGAGSDGYDWYEFNDRTNTDTEAFIDFLGSNNPKVGFLTGDFTCGNKSAFNKPRILYSRATGNWGATATWSEFGHSGSATNNAPRRFDKVIIGGISSANHIVTIPAASSSVTCAGVTISGVVSTSDGTNLVPTLNILTGNTVTHHLTRVNGEGRVILSSQNIPVADWGEFVNNSVAIFEYTGGAHYTFTSDLNVYPNLVIKSTVANRTKILPPTNVVVNGDLKINTLDTDPLGSVFRTSNSATELTVLGNLEIRRQGVFEFIGNGEKNVRIFGDIILNPDGTNHENQIRVASATGTANHNFFVYKNIFPGRSTINLWTGNNNNTVNLIFAGNENAVFHNRSDGNAGALDGVSVGNIFNLIINKGGRERTVQINSHFTLRGNTADALKALRIHKGTVIIDNRNLNIVLSSGGSNFGLGSTGGLIINRGKVSTTNNQNITLDGRLRLQHVNAEVELEGTGSIEYTSTGFARIEVTNGKLSVGGQLMRSLTNDLGALIYNQSGGQVEVAINDAPYNDRGVFEIMNAGSAFTHTGGSITVVRSQENPLAPTVKIDPDTYSANLTSQIYLGTSGVSGQEFFVQSARTLRNVNVVGANTASIWVSPLRMDNLIINSGATFNAKGVALTISRNFESNGGDFIAGGNITTFLGGAGVAQILKAGTSPGSPGVVNFYDLVINPALSLTLQNGDLLIDNDLKILSGTFNDGDYAIDVKNDMQVNGNHITPGAGPGLRLSGIESQNLFGTGSIGTLTIANTAGVEVPEGSFFNITVNNQLILEEGIFNIRGRLLTLGSNAFISGTGFSSSKMIRTNGSFTDRGLRKILPVVSGSPYSFVFPLGTDGKYTPVYTSVNAHGNNTGYINIVLANEPHLVAEDKENVLQYYWNVSNSGLTGFDGGFEFQYLASDVKGNESEYMPVLINPSGDILKDWLVTDVNNATRRIVFSNITNPEGDFTAGLESAFPDEIPEFESVGSGDWDDASIWSRDGGTPGQNIPANGPYGSIIVISPGHTIRINGNDRAAYQTVIDGTLDIDNYIGIRLGEVTGTGVMRVTRGDLPAGVFHEFFSCDGGTLEYSGSNNYSIASSATLLRNLTISGSGAKSIPNGDITVCEDLVISHITDPLTIDNTVHNRRIYVGGDLIKDNNVIFRAGSGSAGLVLNGAALQRVSGDFTNFSSLNNVIIDNPEGVSFVNGAKLIRGELRLEQGMVATSLANRLRLGISGTVFPEGGSAASYINGPLSKDMAEGDSFIFPIGGGRRFAPIGALNVNDYTGDPTKTWTARYTSGYIAFPIVDTDLINNVTGNEYWSLEVASNATANIMLSWNAWSEVSPIEIERNTLLVVEKPEAGTGWVSRGATGISGTSTSGVITSTFRSSFSENIYALGSSEENDNILPVEFVYFKASLISGGAELLWETASEKNNDYFEVQRSIDGKFFEVIGIVKGNGTTIQRSQYRFVDTQPLSGISHYRLKQVDYNGDFEYSQVVSLQNLYSSLMNLLLYPNPVDNNILNILIEAESSEDVAIQIIDMFGRNQYSNLLSMKSLGEPLVVNTTGWAKGVYFVVVKSSYKVERSRIIVK
jgi:hypothetical protein